MSRYSQVDRHGRNSLSENRYDDDYRHDDRRESGRFSQSRYEGGRSSESRGGRFSETRHEVGRLSESRRDSGRHYSGRDDRFDDDSSTEGDRSYDERRTERDAEVRFPDGQGYRDDRDDARRRDEPRRSKADGRRSACHEEEFPVDRRQSGGARPDRENRGDRALDDRRRSERQRHSQEGARRDDGDVDGRYHEDRRCSDVRHRDVSPRDVSPRRSSARSLTPPGDRRSSRPEADVRSGGGSWRPLQREEDLHPSGRDRDTESDQESERTEYQSANGTWRPITPEVAARIKEAIRREEEQRKARRGSSHQSDSGDDASAPRRPSRGSRMRDTTPVGSSHDRTEWAQPSPAGSDSRSPRKSHARNARYSMEFDVDKDTRELQSLVWKFDPAGAVVRRLSEVSRSKGIRIGDRLTAINRTNVEGLDQSDIESIWMREQENAGPGEMFRLGLQRP